MWYVVIQHLVCGYSLRWASCLPKNLYRILLVLIHVNCESSAGLALSMIIPNPGVPYILAKLAPSLWLLVLGLSSHFCHYFLYNLLLRSALVSNIFGKWLQDFVSFRNPWYYSYKER